MSLASWSSHSSTKKTITFTEGRQYLMPWKKLKKDEEIKIPWKWPGKTSYNHYYELAANASSLYLLKSECYLSQSTRLSSLHHTANSHWLSTLHMVMYTFPRCSLHSSHPLLPPLCLQVCCLCLYSCPANRFISIIFLESIYMCVNMWYLFFSFWLHFVYKL